VDAGNRVTVESEQRLRELERQVAELRRVNEQLGRDLIGGAASRQPRSPVSVGRALSKLEQERDLAQTQLEEARQQLEEAQSGLDHYGRENAQLRSEVARLRVGVPGLLRRAQARLRRR
jgi:predicted  nucleic acid-binding Zn-ribbon protein